MNEEHFLEAPEKLITVLKNLDISVDRIDTTKKSKCFDDSKVTAHHAIIPTNAEINTTKLSIEELNVYRAIADFYILQFLPPQIIEEKTGEFTVKEYGFKNIGRKIIDSGYRKYLNKTLDEEQEELEAEASKGISDFEDGNYEFLNMLTIIEDKETKPLKPYTESMLLMDMTRVSKYITDPKLKESLLRKDEGKKGENGSIGTSATRGTIIENLFERGYIEKVGKTIRATELGKEFYNSLPSLLQTADMTALWWDIQEDIIEGKKTPNDLIISVLETVKTVLNETKSNVLETSKEKCPNCESGLILKNGKYGTYWSCIDCNKNYPDKEGKPDFTEKKPVEKSELKCPKDEGVLYKNTGKYGDYWRCGTCKTIYKDKEGNPDLSEKKVYEKSEHNCKCGANLIIKPTKKDPMYCCEKCKSIYFKQTNGKLKKWEKK